MASLLDMRRFRLALLAALPVAVLVGGWLVFFRGGDAELPPLGAPPAQPLLPDLVLSRLADIQAEYTESGTRRLIFSATIANRGDGPFHLHAIRAADEWRVTQRFREPDGSTSELETPGAMTWGGHGHSHWHVKVGASYIVTDAGGDRELRALQKAGFCFFDNERWRPRLPGAPRARVWRKDTCGTLDEDEVDMGLSVGWSDPYYWTLPDQRLDITGLPDGDYRLWAYADPDGWFHETDERNNGAWADVRLVTLDDGTPKVTVLRQSESA